MDMDVDASACIPIGIDIGVCVDAGDSRSFIKESFIACETTDNDNETRIAGERPTPNPHWASAQKNTQIPESAKNSQNPVISTQYHMYPNMYIASIFEKTINRPDSAGKTELRIFSPSSTRTHTESTE